MYKIALKFKQADKLPDFDINQSYSYEDAKKILIGIRALNEYAEMYPEEYANPKISEMQAMEMALAEYNEVKARRPENYGEFTTGVHTPIYYSFYCRDFEKEEEGMAPGRLGFMIDKLSGKKVSRSEEREYRRINYSF